MSTQSYSILSRRPAVPCSKDSKHKSDLQLDLEHAKPHLALPVKNLEQTKLFYEQIFNTHLIAYGKSPSSKAPNIVLLALGPVALSFHEVPDFCLNKHFTESAQERVKRSFIGAFHFGFFELNAEQFNIIRHRIQKRNIKVLEEVTVNDDKSHAQNLIFIQDPNGYIIELRCSQRLDSHNAQTFEQQDESNVLRKKH